MSDDEKFTLTETDHQAIADRLFEKASESHEATDDDKDEKREGERTTSLTDDDRKGIAAHLHELTKAETEAADKEKKASQKDKKDQEEHKPSAPRNLFERSIFSIGGK